MDSEKSTMYLPVRHSEEGDAFLGDTSPFLSSSDDRYESERRSNVLSSCYAALPWLLHIVLLSVSASILMVSLAVVCSAGEDCISKLSQYSPRLEAIDEEYQTVRFRGSFGLSSPYKGPVTSEVDAKWSEIENMGAISITEEEYRKLNASRHAVKVPLNLGGGYMALPEFVHQIHCVAQKMLWEQTYPEYYTEAHDWSLNHTKQFHEHIDHCADFLRQKLMCDVDMTLITYNWINNHYRPHPNFNVQHRCRNFDAAKQWTKKRQINASSIGHDYFSRPEEEPVVELDEPPFDPLAGE